MPFFIFFYVIKAVRPHTKDRGPQPGEALAETGETGKKVWKGAGVFQTEKECVKGDLTSQDPAGFQALSGGRRRALRSLGQAAAGWGLRRRGRGCGERRAPVR